MSTGMPTSFQWNWILRYAKTRGVNLKRKGTIWERRKRVIRVTNRVTSLKIVVHEEWCLNDKSTLRWKRCSMNERRKISTRIVWISRISSRTMSTSEFEIRKNYNKSWTRKSQAQHLHQIKKSTTLSRKCTTKHHILSRENPTRTRNTIMIVMRWSTTYESLQKKSRKQRSKSRTTRLKSKTLLRHL